MRRLVLLSSLATLGVALAEPVSAQYTYPPGGYRGVERNGVMTVDPDDDDDDRLPPPGLATRRPYDPSLGNQALPRQRAARAEPILTICIRACRRRTAPCRRRRTEITQAPLRATGRLTANRRPAIPQHRALTRRHRPALTMLRRRSPMAHNLRRLRRTASCCLWCAAAAPLTVRLKEATLPPAAGPLTGPDDPRYGVPRPPMSIDAGRPGQPATTGSIPNTTIAALPPEDQPEVGKPKELPPQFRRQVVDFKTKEPAGTIVIDTPSTFLYYVNGDGTAIRYGIGVGRDGFTWAGTEKVTRMAEWPDWHPPSEMIERQPYLPRFMAGGESNPMGARALYLGKTIYRVHGTNQPSTIGQFVSSGCIRMLNDDVADLYTRVKVGTKVVVRGDGKGPRAPGTTAAR